MAQSPKEEKGIQHPILSILVGFLVGVLARLILPGPDPMGFFETTLVGIAGSVIGGTIGLKIRKPGPKTKIHLLGFLLSVAGAVGLLAMWRMMR